jgi:hypothetical protein
VEQLPPVSFPNNNIVHVFLDLLLISSLCICSYMILTRAPIGIAQLIAKFFVLINGLANTNSDTVLAPWNPPSECGK